MPPSTYGLLANLPPTISSPHLAGWLVAHGNLGRLPLGPRGAQSGWPAATEPSPPDARRSLSSGSVRRQGCLGDKYRAALNFSCSVSHEDTAAEGTAFVGFSSILGQSLVRRGPVAWATRAKSFRNLGYVHVGHCHLPTREVGVDPRSVSIGPLRGDRPARGQTPAGHLTGYRNACDRPDCRQLPWRAFLAWAAEHSGQGGLVQGVIILVAYKNGRPVVIAALPFSRAVEGRGDRASSERQYGEKSDQSMGPVAIHGFSACAISAECMDSPHLNTIPLGWKGPVQG